MTRKVEQKERSHEAILESAAEALRTRGIAGTRVAEIMGAAGLTVGGFYAHFSSKGALIDAVLRRAAEGARTSLGKGLDEKPKEDRAEVILKRYLSAAHRDATTIGCPFPVVVGEVGNHAPEHRDVLVEQLGVMTSALRKNLPADAPLAGRTLALGLVSLMVGGISLARATRGTELSDEILRACRALGAFALHAPHASHADGSSHHKAEKPD
jgi:TetR/AcrR family transcriptional regulator, transcriptional repressor for nem operon